MRRATSALAVGVLILSGCGAATEEHAAGDSARAFVVALAQHPDRSCSLLAPATREALEKEAGQPCAEALRDKEVPQDGNVVDVEVAGHSALARTTHDAIFLARFDDGWRVTAAACTLTGPDPADCDIKGK